MATTLRFRASWIGLAVLSVFLSAEPTFAQAPAKYRIYIGTYTQPNKSKGIYVSTLDAKTGELAPAQLAAETGSPSFLAFHPNQQYLYAVNEVMGTGGCTAFSIDASTGMLTQLSQQSAEGVSPCHISVDKAGKNLLVANYTSGTVACLPIEPDGKLSPAVTKIQHSGAAAPHAHSINLDSSNRFAVVADLGLEKMLVYKFDSNAHTLVPNDPPATDLKPGSGPRHFTFLPGDKFAYVINERAKTVTAFAWDAAKGTLTTIQEGLSTLPAGAPATGSTAEIVAHPSGKFIYGSNRGNDSIAIFAVDADGKLTPKGHQPTGGRTPRNFAIDPTGTFLLAENQQSDTIVVFRIDPQTGLLTDTGNKLEVFSPVCVRFTAMK